MGIRRARRRADLEAEVQELQERLARVEASQAPDPESGVSRRRFFTTAAAAAAGGVAGTVLGGGGPAGATVGVMSFGTTNNAGTDETILTSTALSRTLRVDNTGPGTGVIVNSEGSANAIIGNANSGNGASSGVLGTTADPTGAGVSGNGGAGGVGVSGVSSGGVTGTGVKGTGFVGVTGETSVVGAVAIRAESSAATGETTGVRGEASSSPAGVGVHGVGGRLGLTAQGASAPLLLVEAATAGAPSTGQHQRGELFVDSAGDLFLCTDGTTPPGTWTKLNSQVVSGGVGFNVLPAPFRIYDSRVGFGNPSGATQGALAFGAASRVIDCSLTPGLAIDAVGLLFNLTAVITQGSFGALAVVSAAAADPPATQSSINWQQPGQVIGNSVTTACNASREIKVKCVATPGCATDFVLDMIGYYK